MESTIKYNGDSVKGTVLDISLQGMFIDIPGPLPKNALVGVEILLESPASRATLLLPGRVVRSQSGGTAIKLMNLNLDSCMTIRNLMMDSSGSPEVIMDEFCRFIAEAPDGRI